MVRTRGTRHCWWRQRRGGQQKGKGAWPAATARHCPTRCSCWLHLQYPYRSARVPTLSEHSRSRRDMSFSCEYKLSIHRKKTHTHTIHFEVCNTIDLTGWTSQPSDFVGYWLDQPIKHMRNEFAPVPQTWTCKDVISEPILIFK